LIQKQSSVWANRGVLLSTYQAELAKDLDSGSTESSRSNVIALWHTIRQLYGKAAAQDMANLVCTNPYSPEIADNHRIDSVMGSAYRQR
jgi:hypothetical protein